MSLFELTSSDHILGSERLQYQAVLNWGTDDLKLASIELNERLLGIIVGQAIGKMWHSFERTRFNF